MEQTKFKRFKRIAIKNLLIVLIVLMLILGGLWFTTCTAKNTPKYKDAPIEYVSPKQNVITNIDTIQTKDSIKNELISEVSKYVKKQAPRSHQFIPKYLVQAGISNNIDICFMMAQTQIETCYGTTGAGRETARRSMFGIIKRKYPSYEKAINHYCEVLKRYYLVKGKTEQHLMVKYTTRTGGKYAGDPHYERSLRAAYNHIKRTTNIYSLQEEYKKL